MGTRFRITLIGTDQRQAHDAIAAQLARVEALDLALSEWKSQSQISKLNQAAGQGGVPIDGDGMRCLHIAQQVAEASDGAFDPTWAALWGLWRFEPGAEIPSETAIAERVAKIGWRKLKIDAEAGRAELTEPGMVVGLGAIGKGCALTEVAESLRKLGFEDFLLEAGGQFYGAGTGVGGPWEAGIRDPRGDREDTVATVPLRAQSVATSGDYERFFLVDGVRYHHLLDPRTGRPAQGLRSATVLHADPTLADAWSTACFIGGAEKCMGWAKEHGFGVFLIDETGIAIDALGLP